MVKVTKINGEYYLTKKVVKNEAGISYRYFWIPLYATKGGKTQLTLRLNEVTFPQEFEGKRIKFKVEIFDD